MELNDQIERVRREIRDRGATKAVILGAGWVAAHTASGADPDHARAAADRTLAFYAGSAQPG